MVAVEVAAAVVTGDVDIVGILKHLGGTATDLANAVCDKPSAMAQFYGMDNHFSSDVH